MGLFKIKCEKCGKEFLWFSGLPFQICEECMDKKVLIKYFSDRERDLVLAFRNEIQK